MVRLFLDKIGKIITKNMILTDEDYEVYIYVFEYIFQNIIFWICAITIGVVCRKVKEMLVFLLVFIPLRKTSGGVHAGTVDVCLLFSVLIYFMNIYIPELWNISFTVGKILEITLATMIVILSPVDCANLKLDQERKKKKKIFTGILSIFYTSISTIFYFYTETKVTSNIVVCYTTILLLLLIGIEKNKKVLYESNFQRESKKNIENMQ